MNRIAWPVVLALGLTLALSTLQARVDINFVVGAKTVQEADLKLRLTPRICSSARDFSKNPDLDVLHEYASDREPPKSPNLTASPRPQLEP